METYCRNFRAPGGSRLPLQPYHPEQAQSHLISEAKQDRAWLTLGRVESSPSLLHLQGQMEAKMYGTLSFLTEETPVAWGLEVSTK